MTGKGLQGETLRSGHPVISRLALVRGTRLLSHSLEADRASGVLPEQAAFAEVRRRIAVPLWRSSPRSKVPRKATRTERQLSISLEPHECDR